MKQAKPSLPPPPGQKPNTTFSVTFPKAGVYMYLCLVHLSPMLGIVEVVPANTSRVPSQADIDRDAQRELQPMLPLLDKARAAMQTARQEPGPNGTTIWFIKAGANDWYSGDLRTQVLEFGPKTVTIKAGDTVVWGAGYFHAVTFHPAPPLPLFVVPKPQPQGPPFLSLNPEVIVPAKPSATYDPTQHYTSGILGPFSPDGFAWALTFDKPGTYEYDCPVHREQGMKGTIVVQAR